MLYTNKGDEYSNAIFLFSRNLSFDIRTVCTVNSASESGVNFFNKCIKKQIKLSENYSARLSFFFTSSYHAKIIIKTLDTHSTDIIILKTMRVHANVVKQNQVKEFFFKL